MAMESVAEVAEHLAVAEDLYWTGIQRNLRKAGQANTPTGRFADASELAAHFRASRDRLIAFVKTTNQNLRDRVSRHRRPGLKAALRLG